MTKHYPLMKGHRRKPNADMDGSKNYGKPCEVCGVGTAGEKWMQVSYMRGEDQTVRVCADDWNIDDKTLIEKVYGA